MAATLCCEKSAFKIHGQQDTPEKYVINQVYHTLNATTMECGHKSYKGNLSTVPELHTAGDDPEVCMPESPML